MFPISLSYEQVSLLYLKIPSIPDHVGDIIHANNANFKAAMENN